LQNQTKRGKNAKKKKKINKKVQIIQHDSLQILLYQLLFGNNIGMKNFAEVQGVCQAMPSFPIQKLKYFKILTVHTTNSKK